MSNPHLTVVDHPLVQHKLTIMRDRDTPTAVFRQLLREISQLLAYEVTRNMAMTTKRIETPMQPMDAPTLDGIRANINEAVAAAEQSEVAILVLGEESILSGEAHCRADIGLPGAQDALIDAIAATGTVERGPDE